MAGRIRTTIKRVEALRAAAQKLIEAMFEVCPDMYRSSLPPNPVDSIATAWNSAIDGVVQAEIGLEELGDALEEKARRLGVLDDLVQGLDFQFRGDLATADGPAPMR